MSNHYSTIYRKDTGEIVQDGFFACDDEFVEMNYALRLDLVGGSSHDYIDEPSDMSLQYVIILEGKPQIIYRPSLRLKISKKDIVANGEDIITVRGLPPPCDVTFDRGEPEELITKVFGGSFEFSSENPGKYRFYIEAFPFLPYELELTAT